MEELSLQTDRFCFLEGVWMTQGEYALQGSIHCTIILGAKHCCTLLVVSEGGRNTFRGAQSRKVRRRSIGRHPAPSLT